MSFINYFAEAAEEAKKERLEAEKKYLETEKERLEEMNEYLYSDLENQDIIKKIGDMNRINLLKNNLEVINTKLDTIKIEPESDLSSIKPLLNSINKELVEIERQIPKIKHFAK